MEDTLTLREIAPPKPATPLPATLKETALASFAPIEQHMRTLAARYKDVAYDVTTTNGMSEAKAARLVLRDEGRYAVQRLVKRVKDEANDLKRAIDARGDEVIAITQDIEAAIDGQITAEETRKAAEKAERDRIERERVSALEQRLAGLSAWIDRCKVAGITAERIRNGINMLAQAAIGDDWAEFRARAEARKAEVLDVMENLHAQALQCEAEAARLAAQRIENERVAAEQAERQRVLDAQAAEIKRQADELAAAQRRAEQAAMRYSNGAPMYGTTIKENGDLLMLDPQGKRSVFCDLDEEYTEGQDSQQVLKAEPATADATDREIPADASPVGGPMGVGQPAAAGPAGVADYAALEADLGDPPSYEGEPRDQTDAEIEAANGLEVDLPPEPATLKIGTICSRLGFTLTVAFLQRLGVESAGRDKNAALYRERQWPAIKAALVRHIEAA